MRKVYLAKTVSIALTEEKDRQQRAIELLDSDYQDFGLVIAHEDGRPYEERQIAFLRRKLTDLKRQFKVRGMVHGAVISIVIYLVMMTQLDTDALVTGVIYCVVGLVIFAVCAKKYGTLAIDVNAVQDTSEPTPDERAKMDREFHIWIAAAAIGCALVALLYLLPSVLG